MPDEYKIYKVFKDDIFGDKIVHLNPYLSNIRNNENFLENYFINKIKELKDKINCYDKEIRNLNFKIDKVVDSLAWFIPFRKKRDEFRSRFNDNFIWGGGIKNIGLAMRIGIMLYRKIGASFPKVLM